MPIPQANETLLREDYKGKLYVKQRFNVQALFNARLMVEKAKYIEITLNGKNLSFEQSDFDINFQEACISDCLQVGENVLAYSMEYYQHDGVSFSLFHPLATESLRNCLYFDTSIENAYIKGDVIVNGDMSLSARQGLPAMNSELYKNGYPFFKGKKRAQRARFMYMDGISVNASRHPRIPVGADATAAREPPGLPEHPGKAPHRQPG